MALQPTRVDLIAQPTGASLEAPRTNAALDLAQSLASAVPDTRRFLLGFADKQRQKQEAKAKADALANSGTAFADAVRAGKIEPTQNPWYIAQYQRDSAQIQAQSAVSKLVEDSQSWAEKTDPAKYNERLNAEVGKLAEQFVQPDQMEGFRAAAGPLLQQSIQSNVSWNVSRIQQEYNANASALAVGDILKVVSDAGGKPTAAQVYSALEPRHQEWLARGGSEADWQQLTVNAVIASATNAGQPELLDILQQPNGDKPPLANIAGPDGTPVAATLLTMKYRIQQDVEERGMRELKALKLQTQIDGEKAIKDLWADGDTGTQLLTGKLSKQDIIDKLTAKGVAPEAIQYALRQIAEDAQANQALGRALMGANGPQVFDLYSRARSKGWSPVLQDDIEKAIRDGWMDINEGEQILGSAWGKTDQLNAEARSDARQAQAEARADARDRRQEALQAQRDLKQNLDLSLGAAGSALAKVGDKSYTDPATYKQVQSGARFAQDAWLKAHPGDWLGAQKSAEDYVNSDMNARIKKRQARKSATKKPPAGDR